MVGTAQVPRSHLLHALRGVGLELLSASILSDDEKAAINRLSAKVRTDARALDQLDAYFQGEQRLRHIGLMVPPELRDFVTIINVPGMAVTEPTIRQRIKAFYRAGDSTRPDGALAEAWEANNLASEAPLLAQEKKIFGRAFITVGANEGDPEHPLVRVEEPRQIGCTVDSRRRRLVEVFRLYRDDASKTTKGTLYLPDSTVHVVRGRSGWLVEDRDDHGLGAVPVVLCLHRRRGGRWDGRSEMAEVIPLTDAIARMVTNMGVGAEAHALPSYAITGAAKGDFVDRDGNQIPVWESYMTAIKALTNEGAKVWQIQAGDLNNFTDAVNNMLAWCAAMLGLPTRYAGQQSVNPAAEGAIRADESRLVGRVEAMSRVDGDEWAWAMGLEERFRTGEWGQPNSIRTLWHDPATLTTSQTADAAVKLRQVGGLSIEGMWDMLGWDEARKAQERQRLDAEAATDPLVAASRELMTGSPGAAAGNG